MNKHTHLGVYGVLVKDNRMLLIKKARGPHTGKWDLPGGSVEFGEEPYRTLQREFLEETGISELRGTIRTAVSYTLIYPYKQDELEELHHIGIIYDVELIDDNFVLKTDGDDQDSLGARWVDIEMVEAAVCGEPDDSTVDPTGCGSFRVTPFVKEVIRASQ
ncbi:MULTISPECIES: NUDIX hydrolase [unclassified Paenibacillus]|uniref:NUDIX hydrolase n=1 Tax=unclassified Paenibacillus TaxID=185978 RepID=UPI00363B5B82